MLFLAQTLTDFTLNSLDGSIGTVKNFYFDDHNWVVRYLIAETGSWLSSRQVLISPYAVSKSDIPNREIHVKLTKQQIEESPPIDTHLPVSQQFEIDYSQYYGFPSYWSGMNTWGAYPYMWGTYPYALPSIEHETEAPSDEQKWDRHLRSAQAVRGYHVHASDGEFGHIEDFIIDDGNWSVTSLVIDTVNWWPGKKVLLSPQSIEEVSWEKSIIVINKTRAQVWDGVQFTGNLDSNQ
jgi:hypothetical protein